MTDFERRTKFVVSAQIDDLHTVHDRLNATLIYQDTEWNLSQAINQLHKITTDLNNLYEEIKADKRANDKLAKEGVSSDIHPGESHERKLAAKPKHRSGTKARGSVRAGRGRGGKH